MRYFSLLVAVAGLACTASSASAQCYYYAPPVAPDMRNPGYYYMNCYGVIYGPNYYVRPWFPPYQGVIPGPKGGAGGGNGQAARQPDLAQYASNPAAYQAAMQKYQAAGGFGGPGAAAGGPGAIGFNRHLFARSPRDYFMFDSEPSASPYNYGYATYSGRGDDCKD